MDPEHNATAVLLVSYSQCEEPLQLGERNWAPVFPLPRHRLESLLPHQTDSLTKESMHFKSSPGAAEEYQP